MTTYVELFAWKGQRINPHAGARIGRELDAKIRGHEDGKVVAMVELGTLALGCMETFGWNQAECRRQMCVNHNRMSYAVQLAGKIGRDDGGLDEDKVGPLRYADGSLPTLTTILRHFGIRPPAKPAGTTPNKSTPNKASAYADGNRQDTRDSGAPAGSVVGQARTQWRSDGHGDTEQSWGQDPARSASLPPTRSGPAGRQVGRPWDAGAGTHVHDPEPLAPGGRASTRAHQGAGVGPLRGGLGTVGGQQLTMDALYAGAMSEAERLIESVGELEDRVGLDAALVMSAREFFREGLAMLREAGGGGGNKNNAAASRVKDDGRGRAG